MEDTAIFLPKRGEMKKVGIVINRKKPGAERIRTFVQQALRQAGYVVSSRPEFIVALGGDGTLLSAAHLYGKKGVPILGVNIGGLGFLTDVTFDEFTETLAEIKKEKFRIEKRMVLKAILSRRSIYGLNDITVITRVAGRVVEFSAVINDEYICRFIADGIIVATPTGSTAYSLATGGPILPPDTEAILFTPIAPHTLSVRPLVLPADSEIRIQVGKKGRAALVADGQRSKLIRSGTTIKFRRGEYYIRLIKPLHNTFFHTLREKMKWGGREHA